MKILMWGLIPREFDLIDLGCNLVIRISKMSSNETNVHPRLRVALEECRFQSLIHRNFLQEDGHAAEAYLFLYGWYIYG